MKRCIGWIIISLMILPIVSSQALTDDGCRSVSDAELSRSGELRYYMLGLGSSLNKEHSGLFQENSNQKMKKPAVGILLSAAVPGAGELYAGKWIKGAIFMSAEIILWIGYGHFSGEGQEYEDTFHAYADAHWSEERWRAGWEEGDPDTHTLPSTKTQQYYEMIGKYDQFKEGWDDYYEGGPDLTPRRNYYEGLRHQSNVEFKRASYCAMAALANHVLSAFDAAFTIRNANRRVESGMRVGLMRAGDSATPCFVLNVSW